MKTVTRTIAFGLLAILAGCGEAPTPAVTAPVEEAGGWVLASDPGEAVGVLEAKRGAPEGAEVMVRGRIGGRKAPMTLGSPVFVIMDLSLEHCDVSTEGCPTPWDYCCETPETITTHAATVQLVGAGGEPLEGDPLGALDELDEVIVVGTVAPRPNPDVLTIRATGVYRVTH